MIQEQLRKFMEQHPMPISVLSSYGRFEINKMIEVTSDIIQLIYISPSTKLVVTVLTVNPLELYENKEARTPTLYINK